MTIHLNVLKVKLKDVFEKSKAKLTKMSSRKYIPQDLHLKSFMVMLKCINFQRMVI